MYRASVTPKRLYLCSSLFGLGVPAVFIALSAVIDSSVYNRIDEK